MSILNEPFTILRADGSEQSVVPADGNRFTMIELRKLLHADATPMYLWGKRECIVSVNMEGIPDIQFRKAKAEGLFVREGWVFVVDENGLNKNLAINERVSKMWGGLVVGDVILCRRDATPWYRKPSGWRVISLGVNWSSVR
jgi:hypothetical protein